MNIKAVERSGEIRVRRNSLVVSGRIWLELKRGCVSVEVKEGRFGGEGSCHRSEFKCSNKLLKIL